jgi:hypothetical protein
MNARLHSQMSEARARSPEMVIEVAMVSTMHKVCE